MCALLQRLAILSRRVRSWTVTTLQSWRVLLVAADCAAAMSDLIKSSLTGLSEYLRIDRCLRKPASSGNSNSGSCPYRRLQAVVKDSFIVFSLRRSQLIYVAHGEAHF